MCPTPSREAGRPTVKTVAEQAGVSSTTVSRVLNGKADSFTESTKQRVFDAVRELDYRPNSLAVGLRKSTTRTIGLVIPDIANAYFHQIARGAEDTAMALGYTVIFCNTDRLVEKELLCLDVLTDKRVDGIIFTGAGINNDRHVADRLSASANVVTIGAHRLPFPSIGVDDRAAIAAAVAHLAEQGRQKIACIGGQASWLLHQERFAGYRDGLRKAGIRFRRELAWNSDLTLSSGQEVMEQAIVSGLDFDAIIAFDDYAALGAMRALRQHGIKVPTDVAVIGCDDLSISELVEPPLSSIAFPVYEFGAAAVRIIVAKSEGKHSGESMQFPYEIRARASSAPSAGHSAAV
jgi:LacI family transcriptional regulator